MNRSLEIQRQEFAQRPLLAMPIAGTLVWFAIGVLSLFLTKKMYLVWTIFIGTGCIAYLGMWISKFTGENFLDKNKPKNEFDSLFFHGTGQALAVYAIAIPFFLVDYSSLPMTVGILTGLMWIPISWITKHWVGIFHTMLRTFACVALWFALPEYRFIAIPFAIVVVYLITIFVLINRKPILV